MVSFLQVSPPKPCIRLSSPPYALHAPPIQFFSIWSPEQYWMRSTDHSARHYVFFLHSPVTTFLLSPNILFNTLFSNTCNLRSSLNVSDQVSQSYLIKALKVHLRHGFVHQCTLFRENKMPALKNNCHWKAVIDKFIRSVAAVLLTLSTCTFYA